MKINDRRLILVFSGLAMIALMILSAGLTGLPLRSGQPFPFAFKPEFDFGSNLILPGGAFVLTLVRGVYLVALLMLPFSIIYLILSPAARRQLLQQLKRFLVFIATLVLIAIIILRIPINLKDAWFPEGQLPSLEGPLLPQTFDQLPGKPPQWLVLVISLFLAFLLTGLLAAAFWLYLRRNRPVLSPIVQIGDQAQNALIEIQQGGDLRNIVIRCYYEMSRVISQQRGVRREKAMTPREFENYLEKSGFPGEPIWQLTQLFEQVRYGTVIPGKDEEREAVSSLTAIVDYCRERQ